MTRWTHEATSARSSRGRRFGTTRRITDSVSGIERLLEIVGEALNRAQRDEPALAEGIPELRKIVGMRNRIIHGYDAVDDELVWLTATFHIPVLSEALEQL